MAATQAEGPGPIVAELQAMLDAAATQVREVGALLDPLDDARLGWRPASDRWSIGEHIVHLVLTNRPYFGVLRASLARARERGWTGAPPYRHSRLGDWFVRSMEPPPRMRMRTLRRLVPPPAKGKDQVLADFAQVQDDLAGLIREANGVDLGRATIRSPFLPLLKLTVAQAFAVILAHNRRHLWHARQVRQNPAFPDD